MRVILSGGPGYCLLELVLNYAQVPGIELVQILQRPARLLGVGKFPISYILELDRAPDHMSQPFFKGLGAIIQHRDPVRKHLLKPGRPMTEPPEDEMVYSQEMECDVPPYCLPGLYHCHRELLHI